MPIKYYQEEELETKISCDNCGLTFAVYGAFARCPDCSEINAFLIYEKSIEVTKKQLDIFSKSEIPKDIQENSFPFILSSYISSFDGLGKELRKRKSINLPEKPKNLFQNLSKLDEVLNGYISKKHSNYYKLFKKCFK